MSEEKKLTEKQIGHLTSILDLIEDKEFPAKRVIADYMVLLIGTIDYELGKIIDEFCINYFQEQQNDK